MRVAFRYPVLYLQVPVIQYEGIGWLYDTPYVPMQPRPTGLIVNTAFFSTLWWLVVFGPSAIRHTLRRRAGKCVKCKYDLAGIDADQPCPECGRVEAAGLVAPAPAA